MSGSNYTVVFDGGSKGNPGPGYGSYALYAGSTLLFMRQKQVFGDHLTSNEAEYQALAAALEELLYIIRAKGDAPSACSVDVRGDSQLVILQLSGAWKARDGRMRARRDAILALARSFKSVTYTHQDRSRSFALFHH